MLELCYNCWTKLITGTVPANKNYVRRKPVCGEPTKKAEEAQLKNEYKLNLTVLFLRIGVNLKIQASYEEEECERFFMKP